MAALRSMSAYDYQMKIALNLPQLHPAQQQMLALVDQCRRVVLSFGRRSGKSFFLAYLCARAILRGQRVAFLAPQSRHLDSPFKDVLEILLPLGERLKVNRQLATITLPETGGSAIFIPTETNQDRARGQTLDLVLIDEAAFCRDDDGEFKYLLDAVLMPTLLTTQGSIVLGSTPNGVNNTFSDIFNHPRWAALSAPSHCNPQIPLAELEALKRDLDPRIYAQEVLAQFVDFSSESFFKRDKAFNADGTGVDYPKHCDGIIAFVDTSLKEHGDGNAVIFIAHADYAPEGAPKSIVVDWDLVQMDSNVLLDTYPQWVERGEELALQCGARMGFVGLYVEDRGSGTSLIQSGQAAGLPVYGIKNSLTGKSKDERVILAIDYFSKGLWKISQHAADKVTTFKQRSRNYFTSQLFEFRLNDPKAHSRPDDLLDVACYSMIFCNSELKEKVL